MTTNHDMERGESSADYARRRGWVAGTRLVGDEGYGPTTITITAVGRDGILAIADGRRYESSWTLRHRDWVEAEIS